jgi:hypothetical protein
VKLPETRSPRIVEVLDDVDLLAAELPKGLKEEVAWGEWDTGGARTLR